MKAAVYYQSRGLVVEETPRYKVQGAEVLVAVSCTGFCGSDHSMIESGNLADGTILGHEVSGIVAACGPDARDVAMGRPVIIRPTYCGQCRDCRNGRPYFCQTNRRLIGMGDLPGAFAEYIRVFPQMLIPVPEGVDSENAALVEAFAASLHGIGQAQCRGGNVLIIGGGPIGLALLMLLQVIGVDRVTITEPVPEKRLLARTFGAQEAMDPGDPQLREKIFELTDGAGFDTVFECSGVPGNVAAAVDFAARGGCVCIVSVIMKPAEWVPAALNFKEVRLTAAYSNTHEENRRILRWMAEGRLDGRPLISDRISLDELPRVYREKINTGKAVKVMVRIGGPFASTESESGPEGSR